MAAWVIPLIATAASTAIGMASGAKQDSANKKAVGDQYKYDKERYNYDANRAQDQYIFNQNETNIARANNENELRYREALDDQNYAAQMEQRQDNFSSQRDAYKQSEQDYVDYTDLNSRIRTNAELQTQNKLSENLTSLDYANQGQKINELQSALGLKIDQKVNFAALKSGARDAKLAQKVNNRQFNQTTRDLNRQQNYTNSSRTEANRLKTIAGKELTTDKSLNTLSKDIQIGALNQDSALNRLAARQSNETARDALGDARLLAKQNKGQINSNLANQALQRSFKAGNAEDAYGDAVLLAAQNKGEINSTYANQQLQNAFSNENAVDAFGDASLLASQNQDELRSVFANQALQNDFSDENANLKYDASKLNNDQSKDINILNQAKTNMSIDAEAQNLALDTIERKAGQSDTRVDLNDQFSTQKVEFAQSIDDLTDQERYQLFEQDSNIQNLSGDLKTLKIQHDTDMAARRFEQEGARLAALEAEGNLSAQGRRGASAARSIATVLAAAGRQQAQLADSILRGTSLFDQQKINLEGKSARAKALKELFKTSTQRKTGDVTEIEERRRIDFNRETNQSLAADTRTDNRVSSLNETFAAQRTMAETEKTLRNTQLDTQTLQRSIERDSTIDQNRRLEEQQLLDRDRKIEDQNENLERARLDKDRTIGQNSRRETQQLADRDRKVQNQTDNTARALLDQDRVLDQNESLRLQEVEDRDRLLGDQTENTKRAEFDKNRSITQTNATKSLKNTYNQSQKIDVRSEFKLKNESLSQSNQRLMASLNANLRKLGIDDRSITNQRTAATENFKTAQKMAANDYKDVTAQWNIGNKQIANASSINAFNTQLRKNEYKSSKQSAKTAARASMKGIAIDEYSANLTADKQRLPKPEKAPKPPNPISYPRTFFQDPMAPVAAPKPIKGVANTSNMLSAAAAGVGKLASINFS